MRAVGIEKGVWDKTVLLIIIRFYWTSQVITTKWFSLYHDLIDPLFSYDHIFFSLVSIWDNNRSI